MTVNVRGAVLLAHLVVVSLLAAALSCLGPSAVLAAWSSKKVAQTGTVGMAVPAYQFSGPSAASYVIAYTVLNFVDTHYPVFTNTGATAAGFTGSVVPSGNLPLGSTVTVKACSVAWTFGTCTAGSSSLLVLVPLNAPVSLAYRSTALAAGERLYLQVKVGGFLATATIALTVTHTALPIGGTNRTYG